MLVVDALRNVDKVVISFEECALNVTVALAMRTEQCNSPTIVHHACRHCESFLCQTVVTHTEPHATALLGIERLGDDVDGTANRRCRQKRCAQTALGLH